MYRHIDTSLVRVRYHVEIHALERSMKEHTFKAEIHLMAEPLACTTKARHSHLGLVHAITNCAQVFVWLLRCELSVFVVCFSHPALEHQVRASFFSHFVSVCT